MVRATRCQAKDPSTCKFHGVLVRESGGSVSPVSSELGKLFIPGSAQANIFQLFLKINEKLKEEFCVNGAAGVVESSSSLKTGYSYGCPRCGLVHAFEPTMYDKSVGGKALSFLFRQLPDEYRRNNQNLVFLQTIQMVALSEVFVRHYKDADQKVAVEKKLENRVLASRKLKIFDNIVIPAANHEDWSSYPGGVKEGLVYVEPEKVPKDILYKFSQCLRKKQHATAELAQANLEQNSQVGAKEVYLCPHCDKYHYGRPIEVGRTEEQRYEFAKKTWAMPAYREAVASVIQAYRLSGSS